MSMLQRFKDIMSSNINALLDKAEDPEKMIDQMIRNIQSDLGKIKSETATVMAEEARITREVNDLKSLTQGSGYFSREFFGYEELPNYLEVKI